MGLDGGTVITRSDVLRGQSWAVNQRDNSRSTRGGQVTTGTVPQNVAEQLAERVASWSCCTISGQPLEEPIVADRLGRLFSKNSVVEYLLAAKHDVFIDGESSVHKLANSLRTAPGAFDNLKGLRDVFTVHLTPEEPAASGASASSSSASRAPIADGTFAAPPHVCPVTALPCTRYPFSALRTCGHVLSNRALSCVSQEACPVCGKQYREEHVIPINGSKEQMDILKEKLQAEREKPKHGSPQSKKPKRH